MPPACVIRPDVLVAPKCLAPEAHTKKAKGKHLPNVRTSLSNWNLMVCVHLQHEPFLKKEPTQATISCPQIVESSFSYLFEEGLRAPILLLLGEAGSGVPRLCPDQGSATPPSPGLANPRLGDKVSGTEHGSAQGRDRRSYSCGGF